MPTSCLTLSRALRHIHAQKRKFDDALSRALESNDVTEALQQKAELEAIIRPLLEIIYPFPELSVATIRESVRHYRELYESTGVINNKGESVLRLPGESTDRHYPMPTEAQVVDYLRSQTDHEIIKHLLELGLVKLAIIPLSGFGNADTINAINAGQYSSPTVPPLVRAVGEKLREKFNTQELTLADGTPVAAVTFGNNGRNFIFVDDGNVNGYINLTYRHGTKTNPGDTPKIDPATNEPVSDWKPLDFMLDPANHATPFPGWQLMLVPVDPRVIRSYPTDSKLSVLNSGQRVGDYEAKLKTIPGLTGWTPEMELVAYLERLTSPGPTAVLRDAGDPADGNVLFLGAALRGSPRGVRPFTRWGHARNQLDFACLSGRSSGLGALPAAAI